MYSGGRHPQTAGTPRARIFLSFGVVGFGSEGRRPLVRIEAVPYMALYLIVIRGEPPARYAHTSKTYAIESSGRLWEMEEILQRSIVRSRIACKTYKVISNTVIA